MHLATGSLLSGVALGLVARVGARSGRARTVPLLLHQAAFVSSSASLAGVTLTECRRAPAAATANGAALLVLSMLPRTSGWNRRHVEVAAAACSLHALGWIARRTGRRI